MSEQLPLDLREYDLPPMWDGRSVTWDEEWKPVSSMMNICPPPRKPYCSQCGSSSPSLVRRGQWGPIRTVSRNRFNQIVKGWTYDWLTAHRCPDCRADTVLDAQGNLWDLGPADYGARGSYLQVQP